VLKGSYTAIFVSIFVHVILLLALFFGADKTERIAKVNKPEVQVIKSFLYKSPKKAPPKKVTPKKVTNDQVVTEIKPSTETIVKKLAPAAVATTPVIVNEKPSNTPKPRIGPIIPPGTPIPRAQTVAINLPNKIRLIRTKVVIKIR
jgi:hypothetical protein